MEKWQKIFLTLLRVALGVLFLYAGVTKLVSPAWSAAGYLQGAKTFGSFYLLLASPGVLPVINFINQWGLTLLGVSLILGAGVRLSAPLGAVLMLLYYFPVLQFPYIAPHSLLVDDHIIYALALLVLYGFRAGRILGAGAVCGSWPLCRRFPKFHAWLD